MGCPGVDSSVRVFSRIIIFVPHRFLDAFFPDFFRIFLDFTSLLDSILAPFSCFLPHFSELRFYIDFGCVLRGFVGTSTLEKP